MKRALIGGIGNVLLGDDAVGPYVVHMLEAQYSFGEGVEIADLGTPALDLTHRIAGLDAVILVDSVVDDASVGSVILYRKEDIVREITAQRLDPHSPALSECLIAADMLGAAPRDFLLVGIVGTCFDPGQPLSDAVRASVSRAIDLVVEELGRRGFHCEKKPVVQAPRIWWERRPVDDSQARLS